MSSSRGDREGYFYMLHDNKTIFFLLIKKLWARLCKSSCTTDRQLLLSILNSHCSKSNGDGDNNEWCHIFWRKGHGDPLKKIKGCISIFFLKETCSSFHTFTKKMGIFRLIIWNKPLLMEYINVYICFKKDNFKTASVPMESRDVGRAQGNICRTAHQRRRCTAGTEQTRWIKVICFYYSFQPTYIILGQLLKGGFAELPPL